MLEICEEERVERREKLVNAHFVAALEEANAEGRGAGRASAEEGGDDGAVTQKSGWRGSGRMGGHRTEENASQREDIMDRMEVSEADMHAARRWIR